MAPTTATKPKAALPSFSSNTRIYERDLSSEDYKVNAYQYGTTSHQFEDMQPAAVIYPTSVSDIQEAIKYASDNNIGIAVRTGGHQYSGVCSTAGENIQLDLSDTFESETNDFVYDKAQNLVYVGVSWSLLQLNRKFRANGLFLPTGQCVHVHLGGHIQTGGYGQLARSFGLISDYVVGFEIVLANGAHVAVMRPGSSYTIPDTHKIMTGDDADKLYWAVLGGSPGNYGILTHVWLTPCQDKDYPDSRGMKLLCHYTKEKCEKVLQVVAEMNDDPDLPRDFDVCVSVVTNACDGFLLNEILHPGENIRRFVHGESQFRNYDEYMEYKHPEDFADGVDYAEDGVMAMPMKPVPMLLIFMQWANVKGSAETFDSIPADQRAWFSKMRDAARPTVIDTVWDGLEETDIIKFLKMIKDKILDPRVQNWMRVDEYSHTPMSQLTRYWCYEDVREYLLSYEKRVYSSNRTDLSTRVDSSTNNIWFKWMTQRLDEVISLNDRDSAVIAQIQAFGGKNSMIYQNDVTGLTHGCHSWRKELTLGTTMDYFYQPLNQSDPSQDDNLKKAVAWQKENDKSLSGGIFSDYDRRVLWGSFQTENDPDNGTVLDTVWDKYFDSKEKYDDLIAVKQSVDPKYIFTANTFSVGSIKAPPDRVIKPVKPRWVSS